MLALIPLLSECAPTVRAERWMAPMAGQSTAGGKPPLGRLVGQGRSTSKRGSGGKREPLPVPPREAWIMFKRNATWISGWDPENEDYWETRGKQVARRNLIWSIVAEHI